MSGFWKRLVTVPFPTYPHRDNRAGSQGQDVGAQHVQEPVDQQWGEKAGSRRKQGKIGFRFSVKRGGGGDHVAVLKQIQATIDMV